MKRSIGVVALLALCACSQTTPTEQPTIPPSAVDTVNFGIDPLWREADTTLALKLPKSGPVTSIIINDPNFILLDTTIRNDTLRISLRFQPQTLANHSGLCLVFAKNDTLCKLTLLGQTTPFVRYIGDAYIFKDPTGKYDSVWISGLPLRIETSDSTDIDQLYRSAQLLPGNDWLVRFLSSGFSGTLALRIPIASFIPVDSGWSGFDPNHPPGGSQWHGGISSSVSQSITMDSSDHFKIVSHQVQLQGETYARAPHLEEDFKQTFNGLYSNDIGFFTRASDFSVFGAYGLDTVRTSTNYHLIRFHLRR